MYNTWTNLDVFSNMYPRLGGLQTIVIFNGSVGKLTIDSGMSEILKHAFGSVDQSRTTCGYSSTSKFSKSGRRTRAEGDRERMQGDAIFRSRRGALLADGAGFRLKIS